MPSPEALYLPSAAGLAARTEIHQVPVRFFASSDPPTASKAQLPEHRPVGASGPVPLYCRKRRANVRAALLTADISLGRHGAGRTKVPTNRKCRITFKGTIFPPTGISPWRGSGGAICLRRGAPRGHRVSPCFAESHGNGSAKPSGPHGAGSS